MSEKEKKDLEEEERWGKAEHSPTKGMEKISKKEAHGGKGQAVCRVMPKEPRKSQQQCHFKLELKESKGSGKKAQI